MEFFHIASSATRLVAQASTWGFAMVLPGRPALVIDGCRARWVWSAESRLLRRATRAHAEPTQELSHVPGLGTSTVS
jgi:hypothetical protein